VNGTAEQFRRWDPYGVDTASVSEEEDVVVFKSPNETKFRLASNALFPRISDRLASATESGGGDGFTKGNILVQPELTAVEPASSTPSPAPPGKAVTVTPLVILKGTQFGIPGTAPKFASRKHATPPGLVEASWDTELSAEA
jgi:hypothetical protein